MTIITFLAFLFSFGGLGDRVIPNGERGYIEYHWTHQAKGCVRAGKWSRDVPDGKGGFWYWCPKRVVEVKR